MNRRTPLGKNRQRGSMGGIMVALLIVAAAISLGTQLVPLYLDQNTMGTIMDKMSQENGLALSTDTALRETMRKRLKMNNIREFNLKENLKTERSKRGVELDLNYEVRIHLVHNLDLIAAFDKKVPLRD
jgi:hypothetical protein